MLSGVPSTAITLATNGDLLESTRAVGGGSVIWGGGAHVAISLGWGVVLSVALPRRHAVLGGAIAGLAIAALDLGVIGRRVPAVRCLDWRPQVLDHIAYGAIVGAVLSRLRRVIVPPSAAPLPREASASFARHRPLSRLRRVIVPPSAAPLPREASASFARHRPLSRRR